VLLRLVYLSVTNVFALLRLFTVTDREKEIEILALRHLCGSKTGYKQPTCEYASYEGGCAGRIAGL